MNTYQLYYFVPWPDCQKVYNLVDVEEEPDDIFEDATNGCFVKKDYFERHGL